jgi:hypothetical protein
MVNTTIRVEIIYPSPVIPPLRGNLYIAIGIRFFVSYADFCPNAGKTQKVLFLTGPATMK